mmetsp:Transcript_29806/g.32988  ORF Transcript_29806/g.32988 Transcript_29806/m.32988 type:complete len:89 (-) Transcript_29806:27-293(-)
MFRRSLIKMSKTTGRTAIRDPRKKKRTTSALVQGSNDNDNLPAADDNNKALPPLPLQPQEAGLGSYMIMGAGVSMGFALVGAIFGSFG